MRYKLGPLPNISQLEKIQRRAIKIPRQMKNMSYEDELKVQEITTLEERWKRGYLIYMYKLTKGYESIKWENTPVEPERETRRPNLRR